MGSLSEIGRSGELAGLSQRADGVVIGSLVGFTEDGRPLIDFPGNPQDDTVSARSLVVLTADDVGREVALLFEGGDVSKVIVVGAIVAPPRDTGKAFVVQRDHERIELTADHEIVLRCGTTSITLTSAGKVLIRGAYISSHSTGVNKIKGAAVHIN